MKLFFPAQLSSARGGVHTCDEHSVSDLFMGTEPKAINKLYIQSGCFQLIIHNMGLVDMHVLWK